MWSSIILPVASNMAATIVTIMITNANSVAARRLLTTERASDLVILRPIAASTACSNWCDLITWSACAASPRRNFIAHCIALPRSAFAPPVMSSCQPSTSSILPLWLARSSRVPRDNRAATYRSNTSVPGRFVWEFGILVGSPSADEHQAHRSATFTAFAAFLVGQTENCRMQVLVHAERAADRQVPLTFLLGGRAKGGEGGEAGVPIAVHCGQGVRLAVPRDRQHALVLQVRQAPPGLAAPVEARPRSV